MLALVLDMVRTPLFPGIGAGVPSMSIKVVCPHRQPEGLSSSSAKRGRMLGPAVPSARRGERRRCGRLNSQDIPNIRDEYRAGATYTEIANRLGVSNETVRFVLIGRTWSHVPDPLGAIVMRRQGPTSEKSPRNILDWEKVREIRRLWTDEGITCRAIAERFGVHCITVVDILKGKTWREAET
jgi:DNA invertase Pin-like site-specific DNA recombinase